MAKHAHSAAALAETANVDDTSPLAVEMGEADEQIGESRVGTVENKSWGFQKVVWIGGAVFVGTVIAALVFKWSSATNSPDPHSVIQLTQSGDITDGGHIFLKSNLTETYYLHVSSGNMNDGDPVVYTDSTTPGSEWVVETVGGSDTMIMLKNRRSGHYLHVKSQEKTSGDPVYQKDSVTDGSKWQVEYAAPFGSTIMLKNVRSGGYLTANQRSPKTCCDPVYHVDSGGTDGSKWIIESTPGASATPPAPASAPTPPAPAPTPATQGSTCTYKFIVTEATGADFKVGEIEFESGGFAVEVTSATSPQSPGSSGTPGSGGPEDAIDGNTDTAWMGNGVPAELELYIDQCTRQPDKFRFVTVNPPEPYRWTMQQLVDSQSIPRGPAYWDNVMTQCADRSGSTQWFELVDLAGGAPPLPPCPSP